MRPRTQSLFALLLMLLGVVGVMWWAEVHDHEPPVREQPSFLPLAIVPSPQLSIPDEEASSPYHLPGSYSFAEAINDLQYHDLTRKDEKNALPDLVPSLTRSLDELLDGSRPLDSFALEVRWTENGRGTSMTIHGDGLGIHWQGRQFVLSSEMRLDMLRTLKTTKFLAWPIVVGKPPESAKTPIQQDSKRANGIIALRIGNETKVVELNSEGPPDKAFVSLAKDLMACLRRSVSGVGIDSLEEGFQKVLDRRLDARTMQIGVHYMRHLECHSLCIEGLTAKSGGRDYFWKPFRGQKTLTTQDLANFIGTVRKEQFLTFPKWITADFDFSRTISVRVLNKEYSADAGNMYGITEPLSPEEDRRRFLSIWAATEALRPDPIYENKKR